MLLAPLALFFKCHFCQCSDRQSASYNNYKDLLATLLITIAFDLKTNGTKGLLEIIIMATVLRVLTCTCTFTCTCKKKKKKKIIVSVPEGM